MKSSGQLKHLNEVTQLKHKKEKNPNNVLCYTVPVCVIKSFGRQIIPRTADHLSIKTN